MLYVPPKIDDAVMVLWGQDDFDPVVVGSLSKGDTISESSETLVLKTVDGQTITIGKDKIAVHHERRSIIFDVKGNTFAFINNDDSTYVESVLPVDWTKLVSGEFLSRLMMFPTIGTIEVTGEEREINGRKCNGFIYHTWIPYEGTK